MLYCKGCARVSIYYVDHVLPKNPKYHPTERQVVVVIAHQEVNTPQVMKLHVQNILTLSYQDINNN